MKFQLFLTEACNLNCFYCFEGIKNKRRMDKNMVASIIHVIKEYMKNEFVVNQNIVINFNGGEPLLEYPLLKTMTEEFKKNDITNFSISTNFTLLSDEILDYLVCNNFLIQLSIDGKKDTHDKFRVDNEGCGSFDKVFNNIGLLKKKYPDYKKVFYSMVFMPGSVAQLYENIKFLIDNKLYEIIPSYDACSDWDDKSIDEYKKQLKDIGALYREMYDKGQSVYIKLFTPQMEWLLSGISKPDCGACQDVIGIVPNGDIIACGAFINSSLYDEYRIGSIYTGIDSKSIDGFFRRDAIDMSKCGDCELLSRCHNKCFAINLQTMGNMQTIPASLCSINKFAIIEADKILDYLISTNNSTFFEQYKVFLGGTK
jgi:uncharacterized protein